MKKTDIKTTFITLSLIVVIGGFVLLEPFVSNAATSNVVIYNVTSTKNLGQGQKTKSKQYKPLVLLDYNKNTCMNKTKGSVDVYSAPIAIKANKITVLPRGSTAKILKRDGNFYEIETMNYNTGELTKGFVLKSKVIKGKEKIFKFINSHKSYFNFSAMSVKNKLTVYSNKKCTKKYKTIKNSNYDEFEVITFKSNKYIKITIEDKGKRKKVYVKPSSVYVRGYVEIMY